ncbi:hypothetical protein KEM54_003686 [Ascosphaera aggregata]|nr:hypothetical protein KEM54_003686 [Ascosphaera aggregata]
MAAALFSDRVLLCVIAFAFGVATQVIRSDLIQVKKLTEVKKEEPQDEATEEKTEDALRLESLGKLTESPNCDLRTADQDSLHALVDCLCNFLQEHDRTYSAYEARRVPKTRPPGETKALQIMNAIIPNNVSTAIQAGVVSRWLVRYPFPPVDSPDRHGIRNLIQYCYSYDTDMATILSVLGTHIDGSRQLRKHGLLSASKIIEDMGVSPVDPEEVDDEDDEHNDFYEDHWPRSSRLSLSDTLNTDMRGVDSMPDLSSHSSGRRQSTSFLSAEEAVMRRRRREAVIIDRSDEDVEIIVPDMVRSPSIADSNPHDGVLVRDLHGRLNATRG